MDQPGHLVTGAHAVQRRHVQGVRGRSVFIVRAARQPTLIREYTSIAKA
ncbi:hypothetical protein GALL_345910 [mine drainage metagenome]|uniref:Uncharacterized protein n=1 Tax=mine drainage metagenome TaxID=410659 RepID=A0A1J5R1J7_9ZZZZ